MNIIEHTEKFLGKLSKGWKEELSSGELQVVCFKDSPFEFVDSFLTVGLSHHVLKISDSKEVRQELIFPISNLNMTDMVVSFLFFVCDLILEKHNALLRGQVIRLPVDAAKTLGFDAVYCTIPVFMEDDFATIGGSQPPIVIVWSIPIYVSEADYIDLNGWSKFEDLLEEKNPDLFSLEREPII
ncbi:suppressor of fused domain protein [Chromatiaceae bacterium AAb-1]|nr:suppressor of fused domain protein [Chromatiaceae bacterium AAb-1]